MDTQTQIDAPALRFNDSEINCNQLGTLLADFRARGYVVVPDVFERDSVDDFRAQVESLASPNPRRPDGLTLDPAHPHAAVPLLAPRLRQILGPALTPYTMQHQVSVHEIAWLISRGGEDPATGGGGWHKDRGHEGMPGGHYQYPVDVHVGMYFRDTTVADGPTACVPGSHLDPDLSPYAADADIQHFLPRKQDVVLWDQRIWHRATPRVNDGLRVFGLFGFYALPRFVCNQPMTMPASLRALWDADDDPLNRLFYGGIWDHDPTRQVGWNRGDKKAHG